MKVTQKLALVALASVFSLGYVTAANSPKDGGAVVSGNEHPPIVSQNTGDNHANQSSVGAPAQQSSDAQGASQQTVAKAEKKKKKKARKGKRSKSGKKKKK
jgi:hypothetical protein